MRKALQKVMALFFFVLPFLSILFSLAILYLQNTSLKGTSKNMGFGITALAVYWTFNIVSKPYLNRKYRSEAREKTKTSRFWRFFLIPPKEYDYAEKLYGIYNNYIFSLPKETWFTDNYNKELKDFYKNIKDESGNLRKDFPQNMAALKQL